MLLNLKSPTILDNNGGFKGGGGIWVCLVSSHSNNYIQQSIGGIAVMTLLLIVLTCVFVLLNIDTILFTALYIVLPVLVFTWFFSVR